MPSVRHILIAERDPHTLSEVAHALRAAGYATWEAGSGKEALRFVQMESPDLAVVSPALPDIRGKDLARILEMNGNKEPIRTVLLAGPGVCLDDTVDMEGGGRRPIARWSHIDEVVTIVNEIFDRSEGTDPELFAEPFLCGDVMIDPANMSIEIDGLSVELTKKEFRFIQILALNEERTCTRDELKKLVWGDEVDVIGRTVDVLVSRLRSKLAEATGRELVSTIRGIGYRFTG
jgi:DNA-binding response OmpR family regulator